MVFRRFQCADACAGVPPLQGRPLMCVDPFSWRIALSPDRKALAVFQEGQGHSLRSLLSGPAMVCVRAPHVVAGDVYKDEQQIKAMTCVGETALSRIAACP